MTATLFTELNLKYLKSWPERGSPFFCGGIDDADVTFFNGIEIGSTGQMPHHAGGFRSAVTQPRLYEIPVEKKDFDKECEILIKVYDFAGSGGFACENCPMIGEYEKLKPMYNYRRYIIDIPRTALLLGSLFFAVVLSIRIGKLTNKGTALRFARRIGAGFNIIGFFAKKTTSDFPELRDKIEIDEIFYRYGIAFWANICFAILILSQVSYKYALVESEVFWFRAPMAAIYMTFIAIVLLYHRESFGPSFSGTGMSIKRVLSAGGAVLTHPLLMLFFPVYLFFLPLNMAWSSLMVNGFLLMFLALSALFVMTILKFRSAARIAGGYFKGVFRREFFFRLIFLASAIAGIAVFHFGLGLMQTHGALIFVSGGALYLAHSISFYGRFRIILPIKTNGIPSLKVVLRLKYKLSKWQADLCGFINSGLSRDKICERLSISRGTLENHLKLIYGRTIYLTSDEHDDLTDNYKRFILFLHGLEAEMINYPDDFPFAAEEVDSIS